MAYSFSYVYFAIPAMSPGYQPTYIRFPNKAGIAISSGTKMNSTAKPLTWPGLIYAYEYFVYRFSYSSISTKLNLDNYLNSWCDTYSSTASFSSITKFQYSPYYAYEALQSTTCGLNTSVFTQSEGGTVPIYVFTAAWKYTPPAGYEVWASAGITGWDRVFKRRDFSSGNSRDSVNIGLTSSAKTRLLKFKAVGSSSFYSGLVNSSSFWQKCDGNTTYFRGYEFTSGSHSSYIRAAGGEERWFALHCSDDYDALDLYGNAYGAGSSSSDSIASYFYASAPAGTWAGMGWYDDKYATAITAYEGSLWVKKGITLDAGYNYTFHLHTWSESTPNKDGIILSTSSTLSQPTTASAFNSAGLSRCSGTYASVEYTYRPTSDMTMYLYFCTSPDSNLGPTTRHSSYNSQTHQTVYTYSSPGYTFGDVYITRTRKTSTVTFYKYGGTGGTTSVTATYGENMPSVTIPTRAGVNGNFGFMGYWDAGSGSSAPGTQYYNADGTSTRTWNKTGANATLYARWRNLLICDAFVLGSFGSGLVSKTDPSSSDNRLIIFTSDSPGISNACGVATHSVYTKVSGGDSITLASGFRCTDGGTPYVSIWAGRYGGNTATAYTVLSTGRGIVTTSTAFMASNILNPPITFGAAAPTSPSISFPRVVAFSTPGGSNYLGATCNPGAGTTFGSIYAFTIPIAIYKQTVTTISASVSANPINVNATTALTVTATYTNGATKMVLTSNGKNYDAGNSVSMTQNPTGVISLSNY